MIYSKEQKLVWENRTYVNILRLEQNYQHFADNDFKYILLIENHYIFFQISLKFVPKSLIDHKSALVKVKA